MRLSQQGPVDLPQLLFDSSTIFCTPNQFSMLVAASEHGWPSGLPAGPLTSWVSMVDMSKQHNYKYHTTPSGRSINTIIFVGPPI